MTTAADRIATWDEVARTDENVQARIHPTGFDPDDYRASGQAMAARLVGMTLGIDRPIRALDFGCGDGRVALELPDAWDVTGCDSSPAMLDRLAERAAEINPAQGGAVKAWDGASPPAPAGFGKFDLVYALAVLIHHTPEDGLTIAVNLAALVAPGGLLVLNIPIRDESADGGSWTNVSCWSHAALAGLRAETGLLDLVSIDPNGDLVILARP